MLLSIAIDPFIQQVIMFDTKLSFERNPTKNNVTIARAQRYSKGLEFTIAATSMAFLSCWCCYILTSHSLTDLEVGGQDFQAVQSTADFSMQSALLYGLTESLDAVTQQITFHCPTGNCKLEKFQSLAVCSVCNDVSSHVRKGRPQVTNPIFENLEQDNPGEFADNVTNATLPSGLFINEVDGWKFNDPQSTLMTTFSTGTPNETMTFKGKDALFWAMSIMKVSGNSSNASEVWPDLPVQATECGLWYCVNEYQTTITNGTVNPGATENRTATRSPKSFKSNNESETGMATLEFSGFRSSVKRTDLMLGDRFNISQNAVDSISSYLQTQFVANLSIKGLTGSVVNSSNLEYNPPAMQPLFDSGSLNDTFHSVAASMTNALRNGADHSNNATGIHANSVTFYSIQWPWMALPIALLFAGYGFLFLSHWETRKAGIPVWKSSDLAVLARGTHAQKILQGAYKPNEMRARSRKGYTHLFERDMVVDRKASPPTRSSRNGIANT